LGEIMKTRIAWVQTHEWDKGEKVELHPDDRVIAFDEPNNSALWQKVVVIPVEED